MITTARHWQRHVVEETAADKLHTHGLKVTRMTITWRGDIKLFALHLAFSEITPSL
jgi:hypothetical protein